MKKNIAISLLICSAATLVGMSRSDKQSRDDGAQNQNPRIYRIWQANQSDEDENIVEEEDTEENDKD